uniref:Uncharacterized protein n=1 Tax=Strongyloides venezuelensis TaxID=75913 RepID=A0A0K0F557_STRVS
MIIIINYIHFDNFYNIYANTEESVKDILYPHQFAIVMVFFIVSEHNYEQAIETVKCYSWHYNYTFVVLSLIEFSEFIFKKHCVIANYVQKYRNKIKYIVVINADIGVVNPLRRLESYLPKDEEDILFYERINNNEIAAGSYIIKNTLFARSFLKFYADYEYKIPENNKFSDNVSLQAVFVDFIGTVQHCKKYLQCMKICDYVVGYDQNMLFVSCVRYILSLMDETSNDVDFHTYEGGKIKLRKLSKRGGLEVDSLLNGHFVLTSYFIIFGNNKKLKNIKLYLKEDSYQMKE